DNILVNRIIDIRNCYPSFFFAYFHVLKVTDGIIGHITKKSVGNEFEPIIFGVKIFAERIEDTCDISVGINFYFLPAAIRKLLRYYFVTNFNRGDRIAAYIGKAIVIGMVVTTFQKNTIGKPVPDLDRKSVV